MKINRFGSGFQGSFQQGSEPRSKPNKDSSPEANPETHHDLSKSFEVNLSTLRSDLSVDAMKSNAYAEVVRVKPTLKAIEKFSHQMQKTLQEQDPLQDSSQNLDEQPKPTRHLTSDSSETPLEVEPENCSDSQAEGFFGLRVQTFQDHWSTEDVLKLRKQAGLDQSSS